MCLNGSLAGLVAITAGCDAVNVFGSFVIGILSGCMVCFIVWLLDYKLKVDDPVGAVAPLNPYQPNHKMKHPSAPIVKL